MKRASETIRSSLAVLALVAGAGLGGCVDLAKNNYFLPGGVDPRSPLAAELNAAGQAPGPYPRFSQIPPMPDDVRPLSAWRATVGDALGQKRLADAAAASYPYSLSDTEGFASAARARIPAAETIPPSADSTKVAEDYAASVRSRAKPPSPPK